MKIVIQGVRGAFHEIAARQFFGDDIEVVPALTFRELFDLASDGHSCNGAMLAIENNIAGSILGNYKLLRNSALQIIGEVFLPIDQHLLVMPGVQLEDLTEVRSHPMALAQCEQFFRQHPHIRLVESEDTAVSAQQIAQRKSKHIGAIASNLAARLYDLEILAPKIQDNQRNYTRFLALVPEGAQSQQIDLQNKTSVCFVTAHQPGSLSVVLNQLALDGANLTKIQSAPIEGKLWEYRFFVDYTFLSPGNNERILYHLNKLTSELRILGTYTASGLEKEEMARYNATHALV